LRNLVIIPNDKKKIRGLCIPRKCWCSSGWNSSASKISRYDELSIALQLAEWAWRLCPRLDLHALMMLVFLFQ
jgi:hypothetical protein